MLNINGFNLAPKLLKSGFASFVGRLPPNKTRNTLAGTVTVDGVPAKRTVAVFDRRTMSLVGITSSHPTTGAWRLSGVSEFPELTLCAVALDSTGNYNAEIADYLTQVKTWTPPTGTPFTPADISSFVDLWIDGADASTITLTDGAVSAWGDKSGKSRHATQTTAANRPITGSINGFNAVFFDGVNDSLNITVPQKMGCNVFAILKTNDIQNNWRTLLGCQLTTNPKILLSYTAQNGASAIWWDNVYAIQTTVAMIMIDTQLAHWSIDTACKFSINATVQVVNVANKSAVSNWTSISESAQYQSKFTLGELIITEKISTENEEKIVGYLMHKWGMADKLPVFHPYKLYPPVNVT